MRHETGERKRPPINSSLRKEVILVGWQRQIIKKRGTCYSLMFFTCGNDARARDGRCNEISRVIGPAFLYFPFPPQKTTQEDTFNFLRTRIYSTIICSLLSTSISFPPNATEPALD